MAAASGWLLLRDADQITARGDPQNHPMRYAGLDAVDVATQIVRTGLRCERGTCHGEQEHGGENGRDEPFHGFLQCYGPDQSTSQHMPAVSASGPYMRLGLIERPDAGLVGRVAQQT